MDVKFSSPTQTHAQRILLLRYKAYKKRLFMLKGNKMYEFFRQALIWGRVINLGKFATA